MTQCRCDREVVLSHLFTLAMMAVCFAADIKHSHRKDKCRFFGFRVIQRNSRSGKSLSMKFAKKEKTCMRSAL